VPRGGRREGAGRKAGAAWKGPQSEGKTALRKLSKARVQVLLADGHDPLVFLSAVIANNDIDLATRLHAAGLALPHVHPRLTALAVADAGQGAVRADTRDLIERLNVQISRLVGPRRLSGAERLVIDADAEAGGSDAQGDAGRPNAEDAEGA
jgi:hypothetical protein